MKKYVERGDVFEIEDLEIFVLNSFPDHGFINKDTIVEFKFGLSKQVCLDRIHQADNQYASTLFALEDRYSRSLLNNEGVNTMTNTNIYPLYSRFQSILI